MIKVQDGLKNQKSELDGLLSSYEMTIVRNDEFIQENIDKQLKKLRERINQRSKSLFRVYPSQFYRVTELLHADNEYLQRPQYARSTREACRWWYYISISKCD